MVKTKSRKVEKTAEWIDFYKNNILYATVYRSIYPFFQETRSFGRTEAKSLKYEKNSIT